MNAKGIVKDYLVRNEFDGLYNGHNDCGCEVSDLSPCMDGMGDRCQPGYKALCTPECDHDFGHEPGQWHIQPHKTDSCTCR